jgi:geranylgeranyl pyrophosphate synthase
MPAVAALGCVQKSIILVDDMLDGEAEALYIQMGTGRAANFALVLQAAAFALLDQCSVPVARRQLAQQTLARLALQTAAGQELDVQDVLNEDAYWRVVRAKSAPFYAEALRMGAQLTGSDTATENAFSQIGGIFGEVIQIHDDLEDAFAVPAKPDWTRQQNNLLILYGTVADYAERDRFVALCAKAADEVHLREAQQLLLQSGAVSYAVYQAMQREQQAQALLEQIAPPDPTPITELFVRHRTPFIHFLKEVGVDSPETLFAII